MTETTTHGAFMDPNGRPAPEPAAGPICAAVATIDGAPVACALPAGHRGLHGFADLPGAPRGSRPPARSGGARTSAATAASRAPGATSRAGAAPRTCAAEPTRAGRWPARTPGPRRSAQLVEGGRGVSAARVRELTDRIEERALETGWPTKAAAGVVLAETGGVEANEYSLEEWAGAINEAGIYPDEGGATMEHGTLTRGLSYGSEEAEDLIAAELRTLRDRGLPAERGAVEEKLLNAGRIALWEERAPVQPRGRQAGAVEVRDDF